MARIIVDIACALFGLIAHEVCGFEEGLLQLDPQVCLKPDMLHGAHHAAHPLIPRACADGKVRVAAAQYRLADAQARGHKQEPSLSSSHPT